MNILSILCQSKSGKKTTLKLDKLINIKKYLSLHKNLQIPLVPENVNAGKQDKILGVLLDVSLENNGIFLIFCWH